MLLKKEVMFQKPEASEARSENYGAAQYKEHFFFLFIRQARWHKRLLALCILTIYLLIYQSLLLRYCCCHCCRLRCTVQCIGQNSVSPLKPNQYS